MKKIFILVFLMVLSLCLVFAQRKNISVYVTEKGKKYHASTCRTIKDSQATAISKEEAEKAGFAPCKICKP